MAPPDVAGFMYHEVTDQPGTTGFQRPAARAYQLTRRAFDLHLDAIATGVTAAALVTAVDFTRAGRYLLLTFDDGGKSALAASEALSRRGWKGHFFIVTSLIGGRTFLSANEIREIAAAGHLIGSHSHTHPDIFRDLSIEAMREEWRVSRDVLTQLLGVPCIAGSVPGGDISPLALQSAADAGFAYCFTSEPWVRPRRVGDCWILGRFAPKAGTSPAHIRRLAGFQGWTGALVVRRLKEAGRVGLPLLYRAYVRWTSREPVEAR